MNEPDHRLVSGAVIAAEMWFTLDEMAGAMTFGRDVVPEDGSVSLRFGVTPQVDVALEGAVKALSALTGTLRINSERRRLQRLGAFRREGDGYSITINMFEPELDRFLKLMAEGLRPRTLRIEFDIEVEQWFDMGEYWDDVRYPYVAIHEFVLEWGR